MKQKLVYSSLSILAIIFSTSTNTTQLVKGPATSSTSLFTFSYDITQKVYSRASGTLYVGLIKADADSTALWRAVRPIGTSVPTFKPVAETRGIQYLALVTNIGNAKPYLAYTEYEPGADSTVHSTNYDGTNVGRIEALKDTVGGETSGIVALSGMLLQDSDNKGYIFAAVSPTSTDTDYDVPVPFGQTNSGVAVICLNGSSSPITLYQTAAESATPNLAVAKKLDPSTNEVRIEADPEIGPFATMHWDSQLQRLYIGLELTTTNGQDNGAKAVVVGQVHDCGTLDLYNIAPNDAFELAGDRTLAVVGAVNADENSMIMWMRNLRTMHCSTGPSYLIVNGGVITSDAIDDDINNVVYALPLVETCPESAIQGTLAKYDSDLSYKHTFVVPATQPEDLALAGTPPVDVGAGPLPTQSSTPISDIEIIGDTVYVSIATGNTAVNDNGIFYSQALFDKTGKIVRWTPWAKRAFPVNAFLETSCIDNGISFFAIDAVTGKVWAVDGETNQVVHVTAWDKGGTCPRRTAICGESTQECCNATTRCACKCESCNTPVITTPVCCTLPAQLCASLPCGCYSVLDLDQATRGFTATTTTQAHSLNRFALFGGCGKVVIARTSRAYDESIESPQVVFEDFCPSCTENNYLETILPYPDTTVCVNVLEYSRTNSNGQCYFFAGTDNGLYVYALRNSCGFQLNGLNLEELSQGQWIKIQEFSDPIIDIKTTGMSLYIVSRSVTHGNMVSTLSRVDFKDTVDEMFSQNYILAQSGYDIFEHAPAFTGIQPVAVATQGPPYVIEAEQLLLATNDGLFGSNSIVNHGIASVTDQTEALWERVPNKNRIMFEGIAGIDTPIPSTVWPISVEDICGSLTFENSWIYQISSATDGSQPFFGKFVPTFFNAKVRTNAFECIDPITYFWSDGARRFFIINRKQDPATRNRLMSFPFNTPEWRVCSPGQNILLFDPYVSATKRFFWVKQIGTTGILMAGTNDGVIALE